MVASESCTSYGLLSASVLKRAGHKSLYIDLKIKFVPSGQDPASPLFMSSGQCRRGEDRALRINTLREQTAGSERSNRLLCAAKVNR